MVSPSDVRTAGPTASTSPSLRTPCFLPVTAAGHDTEGSPLTDEETESYGYPEEMATCVGTVGTVLDHRFGNYEVKCPCLQRGPYYVWPESALELATDNSKETP